MTKQKRQPLGAVGVQVLYCGHAGWFTADLYEVGTAIVVRAAKPVTPDKLHRDDITKATHQLLDYPDRGFWRPELGVFVVPRKQLVRLKPIKPIKPAEPVERAEKA